MFSVTLSETSGYRLVEQLSQHAMPQTSGDRLPLVATSPPSTQRTLSWRCIAPLAVAALFAFVMTMPQWTHRAEVYEATWEVRTINPIIGIHAHESLFNDEFIASSYIKWIESAGGRAVRIPYNTSKDEYARLLSNVNGLLFPGGAGNATEEAAYMYTLVLEMNANGTYFPLWGTCLGFEWLIQLQSQNLSILDHVDARNMSSKVDILRNPGRLLGFSPFFHVLETRPVSFNYHQWAILQEHFYQTDALASFFRPVATSVDRSGQTYIAAMEAMEYPIYGVQFHPEKNPYEHGKNRNGQPHYAIDHSVDAIMASQAFAHFFVGEAKRNANQFPTPDDERAALLSNLAPSNRSYPSYEEVLVFHD
ncbi:Aste57867_24501 [Aphanomyces stellatus]|uniref:folate gamma-glutamyl hydrolase n=1 Tax=Aphanomyces stellatus TaxID=120398 RepID=A0A485LSH3_9STRA|nr:hypothetical protein As57867_024424 [Aphanomyces stellatus]VFU01140.1 Aste57867_24501 [Aphanomyces stellatus]